MAGVVTLLFTDLVGSTHLLERGRPQRARSGPPGTGAYSAGGDKSQLVCCLQMNEPPATVRLEDFTPRAVAGRPGQELLNRADEARLVVEEPGRAWSLDADGHLFRLVSEAKRISLAHLFDPFLAVQTSTLEALPHQIDAVARRLLETQPPCGSWSPSRRRDRRRP